MTDFSNRLAQSKRSVLMAMIVLLIIGVVGVYTTGYVEAAGWQIPQENLRADYLIGVLWAMALGVFIAAWPVRPADKENLLIAWVAKCHVTLLAMLPYERQYDLDANAYFFNMKWPVYAFQWTDRFRAQSVVIGIGWYQELVVDSYHAVKLTFAMIGLLAIFLMYRASMEVIGKSDSDALLIFGLFPSILFWSSIVGKDPIVFFGVALYVYGLVLWRSKARPQFLAIMAAGIAVAMIMRIWLGLILGLPLLYFMVRGVRGFMPKFATAVASIAIVVVVFNMFTQSMMIDSAEDLVAATDRIAHQFSSSRTGAAGSTRDIGIDFTSIPVMIGFLPIGLLSVLYRPLPGEVRNAFGHLAGLENLLLIYLTVTGVQAFIRSRAIRKAFLREPVVIWAFLLVVSWTSMYGFISFQNLGASVRYRLPIISVVVGLLFGLRWVDRQVRSVRAEPVRPRRPAAPASEPAPAQS